MFTVILASCSKQVLSHLNQYLTYAYLRSLDISQIFLIIHFYLMFKSSIHFVSIIGPLKLVTQYKYNLLLFVTYLLFLITYSYLLSIINNMFVVIYLFLPPNYLNALLCLPISEAQCAFLMQNLYLYR